ncbi:Glycoside hydrolase family 13 domain protein [Verrucomicrobia bacterium]|nr:Glycoside hydrolase family 13 domain protein [Verrucomicrobiota bacterium]
MDTIQAKPRLSRYSPLGLVKPVNFYCAAPKAKSVCLVGDFNDWNSASLPMERRLDGWWFLQVPLTHGHHHYRFLVDGKPMLDPRATGVARNEANEQVSLLAVS